MDSRIFSNRSLQRPTPIAVEDYLIDSEGGVWEVWEVWEEKEKFV